MTDEYLLNRGYKQHKPSVIDEKNIVARFQKCFLDTVGKRYFINVLKWSNEYIPTEYRTEFYEPFTYEYEVQVEMDEKPLRLHFFTYWTIEEVESFMVDFYKKMHPDYYEKWDE